ncbi:DEAD/DEAH box helicase [Synechococcus sp. LA31]|uniref:DEAD/DEAH box helicase n=1 Tax=Synechococcus sp. LA31 TaxID=2741953 RepID=UPI001BDC256D|nr:DEAD/DEAH box helicase family protein [Synechococcus sp. LA31]QVV67724.1 DEAD/DEAH box helicase family protein [Synechococcus sp. LA31]
MGLPSFDLSPPGRPQAGLQPRQWQTQLIQLLRRRLERPGSHDVLINAGPGAGKTLGALLSFERLEREGRLQHLLVFCHRSSIASQWLGAAERLGLDLREWTTSSSPQGPQHGLLITYQAAGRNLEALEQQLQQAGWGAWLAIADEVHHLGMDPEEPDATAWGHAFSRLSAGASLRLGLTGTPFRADNLAFCAARRIQVHDGQGWVEQIAPDLSVEPRELIAAGDVRPLEFRFQDGWVDHGRQGELGDSERSPLSQEQRESWRARNLRRAIRLGDSSSIALRLLLNARRRLEAVRREHPGAGGLVIARDIAHARRICGLLEEEGDRVHLVHSQDPEASQRMNTFKAGEADWLVSIDMCAEGFDAPRLRVVAYLTTVVTRTRFVQGITRAVRMDGERTATEPVPRQPSYVFAPADPLLMQYARTWSLSEPYVLRPKTNEAEPESSGAMRGASLPLQAVEDGAGAVIRMRGPELPNFLVQR